MYVCVCVAIFDLDLKEIMAVVCKQGTTVDRGRDQARLGRRKKFGRAKIGIIKQTNDLQSTRRNLECKGRPCFGRDKACTGA